MLGPVAYVFSTLELLSDNDSDEVLQDPKAFQNCQAKGKLILLASVLMHFVEFQFFESW